MEKRMSNMEIRQQMTDRTNCCKIFGCDILRTGVCCFHCIGDCRERCINNPEKCGQFVKIEDVDT